MTTQLPVIILAAIAFAFSGCTATSSKKDTVDEVLVYPLPPEEPRYYYERTIRSSADVLSDSEAAQLKRAFTGESLTGEGFGKPYGIAVHRGRVFVGDTVRRRVLVFDIPEQKFFFIGVDENEGEGKVTKPMGLATDGSGNLYVLDASLKIVIVYDRDGNFIRNIGKPGDLYRPAGVGVNDEGTLIYAVDIGGSSSDNHRVLVYDAITGEHLRDIGERGKSEGQLNLPRDALVAPDGSIYVVDGGNFRVQHFSAEGDYLSQFGSVGRQGGQFSRPKEGAVDKEGRIFVVDAAFGNFQVFNSDEQLLMAVGTRSISNKPGQFSLPSSLDVDEDGRVYVVDQLFRKVEVFRPADIEEDEGFVFVE